MTDRNTPRRVLRLLVATLKGGSSKTTTAIMLAVAAAQSGLRVVLICADTTNRGAARWTRKAISNGYEVPYIFLEWDPDSKGPLSKFAKQAEKDNEADAVLIDTGGEKAEFFTWGCLYADWLISPVSPVEGELEGIGPTYAAASAVSDGGSDLYQSVLLTRSPKPGEGQAKRARRELEEDRRNDDGNYDPNQSWSVAAHVFETEISRNLSYSDMHGIVPPDLGDYQGVWGEIKKYRQEMGI